MAKGRNCPRLPDLKAGENIIEIAGGAYALDIDFLEGYTIPTLNFRRDSPFRICEGTDYPNCGAPSIGLPVGGIFFGFCAAFNCPTIVDVVRQIGFSPTNRIWNGCNGFGAPMFLGACARAGVEKKPLYRFAGK